MIPFTFILFLWLAPISGNNLNLAAHRLYESKEYDQALALYDQLPKKNAAIWYNMGNCAYHANDHTHALLYWSRAARHGSPALVRNALAQQKKVALQNKENVAQHVGHTILSYIPAILIQILFFLIFSVFLVFVRRYIARKKYAMVMALSILCMSSGLITLCAYHYQMSTQGIIMANETTVFIGPDAMYHTCGQLESGTFVLLQDEKDGWTKISWGTQTGWISGKAIEKV